MMSELKPDLTIGDKNYVTLKTVTAVLGLHRATISEMVRDGRLPAPARRLGRMLLWDITQLENFTAGRLGQYSGTIFYEFAP